MQVLGVIQWGGPLTPPEKFLEFWKVIATTLDLRPSNLEPRPGKLETLPENRDPRPETKKKTPRAYGHSGFETFNVIRGRCSQDKLETRYADGHKDQNRLYRQFPNCKERWAPAVEACKLFAVNAN